MIFDIRRERYQIVIWVYIVCMTSFSSTKIMCEWVKCLNLLHKLFMKNIWIFQSFVCEMNWSINFCNFRLIHNKAIALLLLVRSYIQKIDDSNFLIVPPGPDKPISFDKRFPPEFNARFKTHHKKCFLFATI